jgi:hypothetical protein
MTVYDFLRLNIHFEDLDFLKKIFDTETIYTNVPRICYLNEKDPNSWLWEFTVPIEKWFAEKTTFKRELTESYYNWCNFIWDNHGGKYFDKTWWFNDLSLARNFIEKIHPRLEHETYGEIYDSLKPEDITTYDNTECSYGDAHILDRDFQSMLDTSEETMIVQFQIGMDIRDTFSIVFFVENFLEADNCDYRNITFYCDTCNARWDSYDAANTTTPCDDENHKSIEEYPLHIDSEYVDFDKVICPICSNATLVYGI